MAKTAPAETPEGLILRIARLIPDPVVIFMALWPLFFLASTALGGYSYEARSPTGGTVTQTIRDMSTREGVLWIFDNMVVQNFLAFGGGVLGIILVIVMAVGVAEHAGLLGALIKRAASGIPGRFLALAVVFLGVMSSLASDAGYLILVPLAGLLYASVGRHPLAGMAAAFAGVSAGFSANLVPGTTSDVIMGVNARAFAEAQGVPFLGSLGQALTPPTMTYWFTAASVFVLAPVGAWVTHRFVEPRLAGLGWERPGDLDIGAFALTAEERRGLRWAGLALAVALLLVWLLARGPLAPFDSPETGQRVVPYLERLVLLIAFVFLAVGAAFGFGAGTFRSVKDVVAGMVKQMNTMGYVIVLAFFAYNALSLFSYSGLGALLTHLGASGLIALGLEKLPVLLLLAFVLLTALVNLVVGGLTSKWLLLGPMFVPMLYTVNPAMTPDVVAAAYRVGDSVTNIITPMMIYAGVILAFMRRYVPGFMLGEMFVMMFPYSVAFLVAWSGLLVLFFAGGIPFGF
ncbi:MAG: AbgT family transporter [Thermaurantiacus tibetensis]